MEKKSTLIIRILVATLGLSLSGIGVGIFLYSRLGVDPASCFETGFSNLIGVGFGTAAAIINIAILAIVFFIDRSYINISSLLAIFFIGYVAEGTEYVLTMLIPNEMSLVLRLVFIVVGSAIIALGIAVYTTPKLGVGAIDLVSQIITDKLHWTYRWVRIGGDLVFLAIGWLLGAQLGAHIGIGTILCAFLLGPMVQLFRPFVYKVTDRIPGCKTEQQN
ncbi:MAG: DUF6198 family protein [Oscillospiraceae bacterium]